MGLRLVGSVDWDRIALLRAVRSGDALVRRQGTVKKKQSRMMRLNHAGLCFGIAISCLAGAAAGVPIDLTDSTPSVSGPTTLHIDGILTLGSSYWADFRWNSSKNVFEVTGYGEEVPEGTVLIKAGTFTMGSPPDEPGRSDDETEHEVTLTRDFYLSKTEVTQAQWVEVMGSNPSHFSDCEECPVEWVSWYDAVDYCNARSVADELEPAYEVDGTNVSWKQAANGWRLPTEAEWEYGCRASSSSAFYNGPITEMMCDVDPSLDEIGWYCANSMGQTQPVGGKLPNAWGIYDMSGNVWELCWDWYGDYPAGPVSDPSGPSSGEYRLIRGGRWNNWAETCRSADRYLSSPGYRFYNIGFRVASWTR